MTDVCCGVWITEPLAKGFGFVPYGGVQIESLKHSGYCWQVGSHSLTVNYKNCFPSWFTVSSLGYSPRIWNISFLWDMRLSQQCCWIFKSSGMWYYVVGWVVPTFHRTDLPAPSVSCSLGPLNNNIDTNTGNHSLSKTVTHPTRLTFHASFCFLLHYHNCDSVSALFAFFLFQCAYWSTHPLSFAEWRNNNCIIPCSTILL